MKSPNNDLNAVVTSWKEGNEDKQFLEVYIILSKSFSSNFKYFFRKIDLEKGNSCRKHQFNQTGQVRKRLRKNRCDIMNLITINIMKNLIII